ncbi:hypothetical protein N9043_02005 [bacterium]|nr:hypothetical protein [bacterium]
MSKFRKVKAINAHAVIDALKSIDTNIQAVILDITDDRSWNRLKDSATHADFMAMRVLSIDNATNKQVNKAFHVLKTLLIS